MNAYLFNAGVSNSQVIKKRSRYGQMVEDLQTWDSCTSAIVFGGELDQAQKAFENWCIGGSETENPVETVIKKLVVAQFVDQLFTETGGEPPDWPRLSRRAWDVLQATQVDDLEQGYWLEINEVVPSGEISLDIETLKQNLPEDVRSSLNWSPDKKFFFIVSALSPQSVPVFPAPEPDADIAGSGEEVEVEVKPNLDVYVSNLPEMREKEAAALVEARNSVIAAWLWRKYAAATRLAENEIHVAPCCGFVPVEYGIQAAEANK